MTRQAIFAASMVLPLASCAHDAIDSGLISCATEGDVRVFRGIPYGAPSGAMPAYDSANLHAQACDFFEKHSAADRAKPRCKAG